jgi:hypothetical protein
MSLMFLSSLQYYFIQKNQICYWCQIYTSDPLLSLIQIHTTGDFFVSCHNALNISDMKLILVLISDLFVQ